jgi:hypothetical protein
MRVEVTVKRVRELVPVDELGQTFRIGLAVVASAQDGAGAFAYSIPVPDEFEEQPDRMACVEKLAVANARRGLAEALLHLE